MRKNIINYKLNNFDEVKKMIQLVGIPRIIRVYNWFTSDFQGEFLEEITNIKDTGELYNYLSKKYGTINGHINSKINYQFIK
jgi:hypothetical protein